MRLLVKDDKMGKVIEMLDQSYLPKFNRMIQDYEIFAELSRHLGLGDAKNFRSIQVNKYAKDIIEKNLIRILEDFNLTESMHRDLLISYIDIGQKVRCNNKISKNLSKASMVIAMGESNED